MLPDFPKLKDRLMRSLTFYTEQKRREYSGFINQIPGYRHYEGNRWVVQREDGTFSESEYMMASTTVTFSDDEVPTLTARKIAQKLDEAAQQIADQVERSAFQILFEELQASNRLIGGRVREFDRDLFLEGLASLTIPFDKHGNPELPTIVVSPESGKHIGSRLKEWERDPDFERRFEKIIAVKREEWRARESRRKLVD